MASDNYDSLYKRHFDLQGRRGGIIEIRFELIGRRSELQDCISDFQQAQEELLVQVENLDAASQHASPLSSAIGSIKRVQENLSQQLEQTISLEQRLNGLEYELGKEENEFFGNLRTAIPSLIKTAQAPGTRPPAEESALGQEENDSREQTLKAYYDKSSDVPLLEEQLAELDQTFDFERGERETRLNLGQPISPPDLEFYSQYQQEKESLQRQLTQTKAEVNRLKAECVQLGVASPPPPPPPGIHHDIGKTSEEKPRRALSWIHSPGSRTRLEQSSFSDGPHMPQPSMPLPNLENPRDRINEWIAEARVTAEPPEDAISETVSNSAQRQSDSSPGSKKDGASGLVSARPESPESWEEVDEQLGGQKRTVSQSSFASRHSHAGQQPPQKSPKPS